MSTLQISVNISDLTNKVKQHLSVIGKRARRVDGSPIYSDLTASSIEEAVWKDLYVSGADMLMAILSKLSGNYSSSDTVIKFNVTSERWSDGGSENNHDITEALKNAMTRYIWNYAISEYLAMIHPSTGEKYPPIFSSTYRQSMQYAVATILELAHLKRQPSSSTMTYNDITGEVI